MAPAATAPFDWIVALTFIFSFCAALGNGANDVANSYGTSIAARTLKVWQAGLLAIITEFVGAVALGNRVTATVRKGIISPNGFKGHPGVLMLAMGCAELGNAIWLAAATSMGMPVSTTQTVVGAIVGVGIALQIPVTWEWKGGSVSQIAASWGIAPAISCVLSALIFATIKYGILSHGEQSLRWAMRLIPIYLAFTCAILALFIVVEAPTAPSLEEFGAGKSVGIILGVFFGVLAIAYVFFLPYLKRRLIAGDARLRFWHIPLGPLLMREDPPLYLPAKGDQVVTDYYEDAYRDGIIDNDMLEKDAKRNMGLASSDPGDNGEGISRLARDVEGGPERLVGKSNPKHVGPYDRFIAPVSHLSWTHPRRWLGYIKFALLQGVTRDVLGHNSAELRAIHARAQQYDPKVEHMWTYCQVLSAILMSIAHGANDVANAIAPLTAVYQTWRAGDVNSKAGVPVWIFAMAGFGIGAGFWLFGWKIVRAVGNRITQFSPTRGFSAELAAAITVLLASRLSLPVSTTQCLVGGSVGVAIMNFDAKAVNWKQLAWILFGWVLTLPGAGLCAGLIVLMAVNTPRWDMPVPS